MTSSEYLQAILDREAVNTGPLSPVRAVQSSLYPIIQGWAGKYLQTFQPSGSFMKGTANRSGTDIDLFISLSEKAAETLKEIYDKLFERMKEAGFSPTRQNVSVNVCTNGYSVDLVPGKRQNSFTTDHSLYRRKADTWTKTNVLTHIQHVTLAARQRETRILKLWRRQKNLDLPSFYLELTTIAALLGQPSTSVADNVWKVLEYLRDRFSTSRVIDPANSSNIVTDDLSSVDKIKISSAAGAALAATNWQQIVV